MNSQRKKDALKLKPLHLMRLNPKSVNSVAKHTNISDYSIYETLGFGGFAKVKRAIHNPSQQVVAVKVISLNKINSDQRKHIELQIQIHKKLNHSNIAKIYQVHQTSDKLYIFMEYCEKGELFDYINNHGPLSIDMAAKVFKQMHSAIAYLHENGIAHRDIKTENILLTKDYDAKLIDFGMANYCKESKNMMLSTFCGSPCYLSPEILSRKPYDAKLVDIWCLGVTLYVMLTAQLPFYDHDLPCLKNKIMHFQYDHLDLPEVGSLINEMLKCAKQRISLDEIKKSDFFKHTKYYETHSLSPAQQAAAIDQFIVEKISAQMNIPKENFEESLKECKADRLYGMYFIELEKSRKEGYQSCYSVNSPYFMKKRHSSVNIENKKSLRIPIRSHEKHNFKTLDPLIGDPVTQRRRVNLFANEKQKIDMIRARKNEDSPQSPKRILDYTKGYARKNHGEHQIILNVN